MAIAKVNDLVARGKAKLVPAAVQEALDAACAPSDILNAMISAMDVVGEKFKNGEIFVPEMLIAAKAMKKGVEVLKPHLATGAAGALGKVVIGTVAGDLHDIGKNLVAMMIESAGFEVIDLGVDVPVEKFVEAAQGEGVKIMVGGAPINQEFCDKVGADAYTPDAASAAKKAKEHEWPIYCIELDYRNSNDGETKENRQRLNRICELSGAGKDYKIMVGGAPINQEFCDKVGADAYTPDAASAAKKAKELVA